MSNAPRPFSISAMVMLAAMACPAIAQAQAALMTKLKDCLLIEDGYKERLDCYDAVIPPDPKPNAAKKPKAVTECRFLKEQDERLACYNGFVAKKSPPPPAAKPPAKKKMTPPPAQ
jgi:hypothetical protein